MESQPLISFCIPTYNRPDALLQCLESFATNKYYSFDDIEIVISDNSESDITEKAIEKYLKLLNIKYFRNKENTGGDKNFILALKRGTGQFLKLSNDYLCYTEPGLKCIIDTVKQYQKSQTPIFFMGSKTGKSTREYISLDSFVETIGWGMSWIGAYGFWSDSFNSWNDTDRRIDTKFMQVDWLLRSYEETKKIVVLKSDLFYRVSFQNKQGDYNFFKIHTDNYFTIFEEYVRADKLSEKSFLILKRKVLRGLLPWIAKLLIGRNSKYSYSCDNAIAILKQHYSKYYWTYLEILRFMTWEQLKKVLKSIILTLKKQ